MSERLNRLRRSSLPGERAPEAEGENNEYRAFASEAHTQSRLRIECNDGPNRMPSYAQLVDVLDTASGEKAWIVLLFHHQAFRLEGRNLAELLSLLQDAKVKRITEFDSERWQLPAPGEPVITRIRVYATEAAALAEKGA